jgi:hypothetical protein
LQGKSYEGKKMDSFEMPDSAFIGTGVQRKKMETLQERVEPPDRSKHPYSISNAAVRVEVELEDIKKLLEMAKICADDLSYEFGQKYKTRDEHPSELRRFKNDMYWIGRFRGCVEKIENQLPMTP